MSGIQRKRHQSSIRKVKDYILKLDGEIMSNDDTDVICIGNCNFEVYEANNCVPVYEKY